MVHEEAESSTSEKQTDVRRKALFDSPANLPPTGVTNLPPYGAQHRQDALWEGEQLQCDSVNRLDKRQVGMKRSLPGGNSMSCRTVTQNNKTMTCTCLQGTDHYQECG